VSIGEKDFCKFYFELGDFFLTLHTLPTREATHKKKHTKRHAVPYTKLSLPTLKKQQQHAPAQLGNGKLHSRARQAFVLVV
jgi:hypothetical protein